MKSILLILILSSNTLLAQDTVYHKHHHGVHLNISVASLKGIQELEASTGLISGRQLFSSFNAANNETITSATPTLFFTWRSYFWDRLSLGLTYGLQSLDGHSKYDGSIYPFTFHSVSQTIAAECKFAFLVRKDIVLYQAAGLGVSYINDRQDYVGATNTTLTYTINTQLTPLGIRYGHNLAFFAEIGIGYKGLVNVGISLAPGFRKRHKDGLKAIEIKN